jgi:hypothetical protein
MPSNIKVMLWINWLRLLIKRLMPLTNWLIRAIKSGSLKRRRSLQRDSAGLPKQNKMCGETVTMIWLR